MNKMVNALIEAAQREDWEYVDRAIPEAVKDAKVVVWAYRAGLGDEDGRVRDLAASLLEKARIPDDYIQEVRNRLARNLSDRNNYARFRAACALAAHDTNRDYQARVISVLKEFQGDVEVGKIANEYLRKLS